MTLRVVDLFAGPGGWDMGAHSLGLRPIGIELDEWTCRTRAAAGHLTIRADVEALTPASFGDVEGLIASPVCKDFSIAGRRAGIDGPSGRLMWQVPRWVEALRPRWVACEQVPPALPWWRIFAGRFRELGYRTWCGLLTAADYGTPQNRKRAFLLARLDCQPAPPWPTHQEDPHPDLFHEESAAAFTWVTMAQALARVWVRTRKPSWLLTDAVLRTGANTVLGAGRIDDYERDVARPAPVVDSKAGGTWHLNTRRDQRPDGSTQTVTLARPAPSVTGKAGGQWVYECPATTVCTTPRTAPPGHHDRQWEGAIQVTLPELGVLQGFPLDHPWAGNKTQIATQIGDAVPVQLARAVLEAVTA